MMAYCTNADVMHYLGIDSSSDAGLIDTLVMAAQEAINRYCHRTFEGTAESRYVDASGDHLRGGTLYIDHIGELCSITAITNGDGIELLSTEYVTTPRNAGPYYAIRIKSDANKYWSWVTSWEDAIEIEGVWAYSATAPEPIRQAAIMLAAFYYRSKDQPFTDVTAIEAGVVVKPVGIPAAIKAILNGYRKP